MAQYPATIDVTTLDGTDGFRMDGAVSGDGAGFAVAAAGDINGDGYADMIVGSPFADPNGSDSGSAYVVFGGPASGSAAIDLSSLDGTDGFRLDGEADNDRLGISVSSAGDVNGDGIDDLIVGGQGAAGDAANSGAAYVVFGTAAGSAAVLDASSLDGTNGFIIKGVATANQTGAAVSSAGDINGDGIDDLVVGAPRSGSDNGSSYVVFGHTGGFAAAGVDLASLDGSDGFRIDGVSSGDFNGTGVASAGDVNGDGMDDLRVSSYGATPNGSQSGSTYVVFGSASPFAATFDLSSLDGTNGFRLDGVAPFDKAGASIASADINGDGYADMIVGAPDADPHGAQSGAAYVVFGKASGFSAAIDLGGLSGADGFRIDGLSGFGRLGFAVASAGDVNGDGFDDVIAGSFGVGSYVVFGKASGFGATFDLTSLDGTNGFALSDPAGESFGFGVASAGDINGDGLSDLILGAESGSGNAGSAYVVYGALPDAAVNRTGTAASQSLVGGDFADKLRGAQGDDALWGHGDDDKLHGNKGDDTLNGGDGNDKLKADGGDDVLNGGQGRDVMTGGVGNDVFLFADGDSTGAAPDLIRDFASGQDLIDLHLIDADAGTSGDQAFHLAPSFSGAAGELIVSRLGPYTLVGGDTDGDGTADFVLVLSGHHALTGADFVL